MSAWVTRERTEDALDSHGKPYQRRTHERVGLGRDGVQRSDRFVVEWHEPNSRKRRREKVAVPGAAGKDLADERCVELNTQFARKTYVPEDRSTWEAVRDRYLEVTDDRRPATKAITKKVLARFEKLIKSTTMESPTTPSLATPRFAAGRRIEPASPSVGPRSTKTCAS